MPRIKILQITEAAEGGVLKHLMYLCRHLDPHRFEISVLLSDKRMSIDKELNLLRQLGIKVFIVPMRRRIQLFYDLLALILILTHLQRFRYDVVHTHSSKAGALGRVAAFLSGIRSIYYTPHCFYFQSKSGYARLLFLWIEKLLSRITTGIIVSEGEAEIVTECDGRFASKIININNAIDFDEYKQVMCIKKNKERFGLSPASFVIGSVGRLVRQKDWPTFIYAANEISKEFAEVRFLIVGRGELSSEISALISRLNLNGKVIVIGHVEDIHSIYGILDLFVNTSLWEGLPYVFLEAMNYAIPIIATDTNNSTVIVNNVTGFVTPPRDFVELAARIKVLIQSRLLQSRMGIAGLNHLRRKYSFDLFIIKHEKVYAGCSYSRKE